MIQERFERFKDAPWFGNTLDIFILGAGGIGSYVAYFVARLGHNLYIYDNDKYEDVNLAGQLVGTSAVGKNKAEAIKSYIQDFSPGTIIETFGKYENGSMSNNIVICGFDNMEARKIAFTNWKNYVLTLNDAEKQDCLFIDGRLLADLYQIFIIRGEDLIQMQEYETNFLFNDDEAVQELCTFKQTSHCAGMIGSMITGILTNWIAEKLNPESGYYNIPFFVDFHLPSLYYGVKA